ncbi:hypothetical protein EOL96_03115 [Candidatus Saccharibacteria bacterium]|nr:hypothetical protein [Candidatus Saccharibacteria bacterium]
MVRRSEQGDTIIEMVMAFAVFSFAVILTTSIMNKGIAISQQSLEVSQVRQQIDSQAEIIRYIHATNNPAWQQLVGSNSVMGDADDKITTSVMPLNSSSCPTSSDLTSGSRRGFIVAPSASLADVFLVRDANATVYANSTTIAKVIYPSGAIVNPRSEGLWVQIAEAEDQSGSARAYDVYIHGCWPTLAQSLPMTLGTIVRLYDR